MIRVLKIQSEFSSAHLYKNASFSVAENKKQFGRCYSKYGHGHNYRIEVGFQVSEKIGDTQLIKINEVLSKKLTALTQKLDHEHLNFVIPEFKKTIPTTENILLYFEKKLASLKLPYPLISIKLFEMENLWSEKYYVTV
ncbi:MAG: hypothetical protein A2622_12020 [Bdellovibrionales bacterium RIFCSPHIGHO2_01_FULL_40_29]|nr:MAG: hypothetical protein A2622_12020 [Bdellovibrionales bacterium RIFCSPHIGHO2_01_FULL_40_29]OFZ35610.1 MAG: hypothetical protein A3D17_00520 [Bdellovibrionales bacterium RIFCSPHIGHO2_02_FULL_40_15]